MDAPLFLVPELVRRLWGGDTLPALLGVTPPPGDEPVAEAWLAYAGSVVAGGPHAGDTLQALAEAHGAQLLGAAAVARSGARVPLLAKLLDAGLELSVQVHPGDAYALRHHRESGHVGKTESWLVLHAEPDAEIVWGLARPAGVEEVRAAIRDGTLDELLRRVPVRPGDAVHNPAGTVHAVGAGSMIYELQQASDLTYRLWDHGRVGADGRPRELHLAHGLAVADLSAGGSPHPSPAYRPDGWITRATCPYYRLDETHVRSRLAAETDGEAMHVLTVLDGTPVLAWSGGRATLSAGRTAVLPAALGAYALEGSGHVVRGVPR
ncbi:MAG: type I phosphomannose isomerase catalytic subunit [Trueperaceae bacterium]|nr:type I phosphomannose isomerase catalytic subunit [Trueperaceae bacterium]